MKQYRAVITDLDNTLFDWLTIWYEPFRAMLDEINKISGIPEEKLIPQIRAIHQKYGTSEYAFLIEEVPLLIKASGKVDPKTKFATAIDAYRERRRSVLKLYPGVSQTLRKLKQTGVTIAAYTESMAFYSNYRVRKLELDGLLDFIYSPPDHDLPVGLKAEDIRKYPAEKYELKVTKHRHIGPNEKKPNPAVLLDISKDLGIQPSDCIYIGDDLIKDVSMAKEAGITDVWAKYGKADTRREYDLLKKVTHWTPGMVNKQSRISQKDVNPSYIFEASFAEILANFDFVENEKTISVTNRAKNAIEVWKGTVEVQQHFNEIEMKIRALAVTVVGALLGAAALSFKDALSMEVIDYRIPVTAVLLATSLFTLYLFYFMDRHWYHRLLKGAVDNARLIETKYADLIPEISLTNKVSQSSPVKVLTIVGYREWHSDDKILFFYRFAGEVIFLALLLSIWAFPKT